MTTRSASNPKINVIFAGKPGAGKSTLLNSLTGSPTPIFRAGVNLATGMTTRLQRHEITDCILGDTPGLADVETKKRAAQEITELFRSAGIIKLIFVVTLESGRIRPADATTIELILDAFQGVNLENKFGIIINKVSRTVKQQIEANGGLGVFDALMTKYKTCHMLINEFDVDLHDANNVVKAPSQAIIEFIRQVLVIQHHTVQPIKADALEQLKEEYDRRLEQLYKENNERHEAAMRSLRDELNQLRQSQAAAVRRGGNCIIL